MASPPTRGKHQRARGEAPELRFLARAQDYEIALLVPPPASRSRSAAAALVRLRFRAGQVEVVLTPAQVVAFSTALQRLQEYPQHEPTDRPHPKRR